MLLALMPLYNYSLLHCIVLARESEEEESYVLRNLKRGKISGMEKLVASLTRPLITD